MDFNIIDFFSKNIMIDLMNKDSGYIHVFGVGPGSAGASVLVDNLSRKLNKSQIICPQRHISISSSSGILGKISSAVKKISIKMKFYWRCIFLHDKNLILYGYLQVGILMSIWLYFRNRSLHIYLLDSSFFCIKSYNSFNNKECLRCVVSNNIERDCFSFPGLRIKFFHLWFLKYVRCYHSRLRIQFLCQNERQCALLKLTYGDNVRATVVGLPTSSDHDSRRIVLKMSDKLIIDARFSKKGTFAYRAVFHGAAIEAKGVHLALDIAIKNPNILFVFPFSNCRGLFPSLSNCLYVPLTWNTGLRELCAASDIILNLSCWSAPIEMALVKSISLQKHVLVVDSIYGYTQELIGNNRFISVLKYDHQSNDLVNVDICDLHKSWLDSIRGMSA